MSITLSDAVGFQSTSPTIKLTNKLFIGALSLEQQAIAIVKKYGGSLWAAGSAITDTYSDSAGTILAVENGTVAHAKDKAGALNMLQATTANQPLLGKTANGKYYYAFDGVNDSLTNTTYATDGNYFMACSAEANSLTNISGLCGSNSSSNAHGMKIAPSATNIQCIDNSAGTVTLSSGISVGVPFVEAGWRVKGISVGVALNGVEATNTVSASVDSNGDTYISLGYQRGIWSAANAKGFGFLFVPAVPTPDERTVLYKYLASLYGGVL